MSFESDVAAFAAKLRQRTNDVFVNTASAVKDSWVSGSPITGAPALPVDTGNLRNGVHLEFLSPSEALISTNVEYAEIIESNIRGATFRNGGPHGLKMTVAGFQRLVDVETRKVNP